MERWSVFRATWVLRQFQNHFSRQKLIPMPLCTKECQIHLLVRVLESYDLAPPKQKMPWEISEREHRDYEAKLRACNNLRRQTGNSSLDCVPPTTETHKAVFSLVVSEMANRATFASSPEALGTDGMKKKWYFGPAIKDDQPVAVRIDIPVTYTYQWVMHAALLRRGYFRGGGRMLTPSNE